MLPGISESQTQLAPGTGPRYLPVLHRRQRQTNPQVASPEESLPFYRNFYRTGRHNTASNDSDRHANLLVAGLLQG